jgi:hypothetical protein
MTRPILCRSLKIRQKMSLRQDVSIGDILCENVSIDARKISWFSSRKIVLETSARKIVLEERFSKNSSRQTVLENPKVRESIFLLVHKKKF